MPKPSQPPESCSICACSRTRVQRREVSGLSEKRRLFVEAYMGEAKGNATRAAEIAGYASPKQQGSRLLTYDDVQAALGKRQKADPLIATREDRQRFWTRVMLGTESDEFDTKDRLKASELLGKSGGDFITKVDVTSGGESIRVAVVVPSPSKPGD